MIDASAQCPPQWSAVDIDTLVRTTACRKDASMDSELPASLDTPPNLTSAPESSEFESFEAEFVDFSSNSPQEGNRTSTRYDGVHVYDYSNDPYDPFNTFGFLNGDSHGSAFDMDITPESPSMWSGQCGDITATQTLINPTNLIQDEQRSRAAASHETSSIDLDGLQIDLEQAQTRDADVTAATTTTPAGVYGLGITLESTSKPKSSTSSSLLPSPPRVQSRNIDIVPQQYRTRISAEENKAAALAALATLEEGGDSDGDEDFSPEDDDSEFGSPSKASLSSWNTYTQEQMWSMEFETESRTTTLSGSGPGSGSGSESGLALSGPISIEPVPHIGIPTLPSRSEETMKTAPAIGGRVSKRRNEKRFVNTTTPGGKGQVVPLPTPAYAEGHEDAGKYYFWNLREKCAWRRSRR